MAFVAFIPALLLSSSRPSTTAENRSTHRKASEKTIKVSRGLDFSLNINQIEAASMPPVRKRDLRSPEWTKHTLKNLRPRATSGADEAPVNDKPEANAAPSSSVNLPKRRGRPRKQPGIANPAVATPGQVSGWTPANAPASNMPAKETALVPPAPASKSSQATVTDSEAPEIPAADKRANAPRHTGRKTVHTRNEQTIPMPRQCSHMFARMEGGRFEIITDEDNYCPRCRLLIAHFQGEISDEIFEELMAVEQRLLNSVQNTTQEGNVGTAERNRPPRNDASELPRVDQETGEEALEAAEALMSMTNGGTELTWEQRRQLNAVRQGRLVEFVRQEENREALRQRSSVSSIAFWPDTAAMRETQAQCTLPHFDELMQSLGQKRSCQSRVLVGEDEEMNNPLVALPSE